MCGALVPVEALLVAKGGAVGIEHLEQVVAGDTQVGGVQLRGLLDQELLRTVAHITVDGEPGDHGDDDLRVLG